MSDFLQYLAAQVADQWVFWMTYARVLHEWTWSCMAGCPA